MSEYSLTRKSPFTVSEREAVQLGNWSVAMKLPASSRDDVLLPRQVHGGNVAEADSLAGRQLKADGVLVKEGGPPAGVETADCAAAVITSDKAALVLHISRKTLIHGLLDNAAFFIAPRDINHVYVGPHICEYHFDFSEESWELRMFRYRYAEAVHFHQGKLYLSLRKALAQIFTVWQVHPDRITEDGRCTYEQLYFPSRRRWREEGSQNQLPLLQTTVAYLGGSAGGRQPRRLVS